MMEAVTVPQLAREFGVSKPAIDYWLFKLNVEPSGRVGNTRVYPQQVEKLIADNVRRGRA